MSIAQNFPNIKPSLMLSFADTRQLDNRVTFTRSTPAVYYDGKTTAMAEQNLVSYSQQFDNSGFTKYNSTISADSTTAPDGTTTADTLTENTANNSHAIWQYTAGDYSSKNVTLSVYVKANGRTRISIGWTSSICIYAFDLTAVSTTLLYGSGTATITSVGNGWYRCTVSCLGTNTMYWQLNLLDSSNNSFYTGDGTSGAYIWGAQLEQRSSATAYTATTTQPITNYIPVLLTAGGNQPRFDCNPTTGESLGLLIEEQRTNLLTYSQDLSNAAWAVTNCTKQAATLIAPDGTLSAGTITSTAVNNNQRIQVSATATAGVAVTFSAYVKKGTNQYVCIGDRGENSEPWATFDFNAGTIAKNATVTTATATLVGNGWYRISISWTKQNASFGGNIAFVASATPPSGTPSFNGTGYDNFFIWGAQLEAGAFATSYIATTSASATRTADIAQMTGTNFSSWFNYGQMTIYWEATGYYNDGGFEVFDLDSGSNTGRIRTRFGSNSQVDQLDASGGLPVSLDGGTVTANVFSKLATGLTQNSQALSFNNGAVVTSTAPFTSLPIPTAARIGTNWVPSEFLNGTIKKIAFYPIKATNAQLQALTS